MHLASLRNVWSINLMETYLEALERLGRLLDAGVLTKEEFDAEKAHLLQTRTLRQEVPEPAPRSFPRSYFVFGSIAAICAFVAVGAYFLLRDVSEQEPSVVASKERSPAKSTAEASTASITFSDPSKCEPGAALSDLLNRLREAGAAEEGSDLRFVYLAGTPEPVEVQSAFQRYGDQQVRLALLPVSTEWKGLRVTEIRTAEWDQGNGFQLRFASSPENVLRALKESGFTIQEPSTAATAKGTFAGIEKSGNGTTLTCMKSNKAGSSSASDVDANE